jgi:hypothetical protein
MSTIAKSAPLQSAGASPATKVESIYRNLSKFNPDIVEDTQTGSMVKYQLTEQSVTPIPLSVLKATLDSKSSNGLERRVEFQRESDEHKGKTAQQIVADYLTGQKMGYISCYSDPNKPSQPRMVIDGRHRLTHLESFLNGDLVLKDKEASQFWATHLAWLDQNSKGNTKINLLLKKLSEEEKIPQVKYTDFDHAFQVAITSHVSIDINEIKITCTDSAGNAIHTIDPGKVEELYYRKFLKINQNSASMKPEDIFWGSGSEYNSNSRSIIGRQFFQLFFGIDSRKDMRTLNQIILTSLLFVDGKTKWGAGGKKLAEKINEPQYANMAISSDSRKFMDLYNKSIIPNMEQYMMAGGSLALPAGIKGIGGKGTNVKYMLYFLYKLHEAVRKTSASNHMLLPAIYANKLPTNFLISLIETGAEAITSAIKDQSGRFNSLTPRSQAIYSLDPTIFERLNDYRSRGRDKATDIDPVFEDLIRQVIIYNLPTAKMSQIVF